MTIEKLELNLDIRESSSYVASIILLKPKSGCDPEVYEEFMNGTRGLGLGFDLEGKPIGKRKK